MYLSRIKLNTSKTRTMQALAAPNIFHGAIEESEKEGRTRKLWRIDSLRGEEYLLILSEKEIDFSEAALQFGYNSDYESKYYDNFLNRISNGSEWQFRLKANPTVQKFSPKKGRGKVIAHITPKHQEEWLKNQSVKYGFSLTEGKWLVTGSKWYIFNKNRYSKIKVKLLAVTYEGRLTVTDADALRKALVNGIGREKAYGLGLLTLAGIKNE